MNIIPLAAESLGVRSAAFFIETSDVKALIDPGVSLAAVRHGLPPHPIEIKAMNESWVGIKKYAALADVLIITHYHFDHYDATEPVVFNNKTLLIKHPKEHINSSQQERAKAMIKSFRTLPRRVEFADGNTFKFGSTTIRFSKAVPHGPSTKVGWVVEVSIRQGDECFLHSSDIQGACLPEHMEFIRSEDPSTLYLDGPLTYMLGREFTEENLRTAIRNTCELLEKTRVQTIILDHHLLRDQHWKAAMAEVFDKAKKTNKQVVTAAGFLDREDEILEAHRQQLFAFNPDMPEEPIKRSKNFHLVKDLGK